MRWGAFQFHIFMHIFIYVPTYKNYTTYLIFVCILLTVKMTLLEGQASLGASKLPILSIFVCYSPCNFGDPEF